MRAISKKVQKVMDRIVELLGGKESLKLDNAPEAYMPLSVDRTGDNTFALAHYGEQNGDLMADPDMVFWRPRIVRAVTSFFGTQQQIRRPVSRAK